MTAVTFTLPRRKPCQNLVHLVASPIVYATAPSARSLAAPSNESYNNSQPSIRSQEPILIDFPSGWQTGSVHEWYTRQPTTRFLRLEYRKDLTGTFRHEFIVMRLDNGTCCRFDRRAKQDLRVHAVKDKGTVAEDTAHVLHSSQPEFTAIEDSSELILIMSFPEGRNMLLILAIFFSIRSNAKSRRYTLTRYNCYFVCWTITLIVARCTTDWSTLVRQWDNVVEPIISYATSYYICHRSTPTVAHWGSLGHDPYSPTCHAHLFSTIPCFFECLRNTNDLKALHTEISNVGSAIETVIQNSLLKSKIRALGCELIQMALMNDIIELAGRHALYIRHHIRINRRIYLNRGHLFFTRVYEPGRSKAVTEALERAAAAATSSSKLGLNNRAGKNWNREWDMKWEEAWPTEGQLMHWGPGRRLFRRTDQCELDHESSALLRSRHKIGWMKEFKTMMQLSKIYLPLLTKIATSSFSKLLVDLDPARFMVGGVKPLETSSIDADAPLSFQSIID
ncbi:hypothetical protein FRC12_024860 [Ceratobasidium sp. 428]|nr:hypothetical protein FRC12_024860 [Ceratobasidium sp. 428]